MDVLAAILVKRGNHPKAGRLLQEVLSTRMRLFCEEEEDEDRGDKGNVRKALDIIAEDQREWNIPQDDEGDPGD